MIPFIYRHKVELLLTFLFVLAFGCTTFFLISANADLSRENRDYKSDIKELTEVNKRNKTSIDSLKSVVAKREIQDSILKAQINQLPITTTNANHRTIINLPVDSFMQLFTGYIDSAGKAIN